MFVFVDKLLIMFRVIMVCVEGYCKVSPALDSVQ